MIKVNKLNKAYGTHSVLEDISFSMSSNEKIGLVGRNGSGKSTLFKIILGKEVQDDGHIQIPKHYHIASLSQTIVFSEKTAIEECCKVLPKEEQHETYRAEKILLGLGLTKEEFKKSPEDFSGGYQVRICLAKVLLQNPNLLLLDEPTNYLDIVSMRWLEKFLKNYPGEIILITHDKTFMDKVCSHVMGITRKSIKKVKGKTSNFYEQIQIEDEKYEQTRQNHEKKKQELEKFVTRFKAKASKAKQAQSRLKQLDKMGSMDKLSDDKLLGFNFPYQECPAKIILEANNINFKYEDDLPFIIQGFNLKLHKNDRIGIIGKNGKGKSTLLNILADELAPISGSISLHSTARRGHFGQTNINRLNEDNSIYKEVLTSNEEMSITETRKICGTIMFSGDLAEKKIKVLSGGEKSRVLIGKLLAKPSNILLLDEPTNHLDMESIESLGNEIQNYPGATIIVTHNEALLRSFANKLIIFHRGKIELFEGNYDDFLEKIGWEEELLVSSTNKLKTITKKEYKNLRAKLIQERSTQTSPLKKIITSLESDIEKKENQLEVINQELVLASSEVDGNKILKLASQVQELEKIIDINFNKLVDANEEHDRITYDFQIKLNELDDKK